jgi:hypothetical protein
MRKPRWFTPKKIVVDPYALGWATIGAAGIGYEVAMAADGHPERTLSAYVRRALGLNPRRSWAPGGVAVLGLSLMWLGVHLGLGILPRQ